MELHYLNYGNDMSINYLLKETNKIIQFKKLIPFFFILTVIGITLIFSKLYNSKKPNEVFYKTTLLGRVNGIYAQPKNTFFKIGAKWYLIKDECITHISIGDSIIKNKDSFQLIIWDRKSNIIKYKEDVKSLIFKPAGSDSIPNL